jgi:hypothetical protein
LRQTFAISTPSVIVRQIVGKAGTERFTLA